MKYVSTRGKASPLGFCDVVLEGLADDGGLFVPESMPQFSLEEIESWREFSYTDLSFEVMRPFICKSEISDAELRTIIDDSYVTFRHKEITPVHRLHGGIYLLELFHGPTWAFKDLAMQFLGNLFSFVLVKRDARLRILGATSGDTGSAALYALCDKPRLDCCILFPKGRTSRIQELQMTTVAADNVHCASVIGNFDNCQQLVKEVFGSPLKRELSLGAINSINWARIMAQIVYYFYAYFRLPRDHFRPITFSVPTGNFGDAFAGYYAKLMGLPIKLIVATNSNDILTRFFKSGTYERFDVMPTMSPSMDIQVSSNFERFLYHLYDRNSAEVVKLCQQIASSGYCEVPNDLRSKASMSFSSFSIAEKETQETVEDVFNRCNYLLDPHTAVGYAALIKADCLDRGIVLATAHFGKFSDSLLNTNNAKLRAHIRENMPDEFRTLETKPTHCTTIKATVKDVERLLRGLYRSKPEKAPTNPLVDRPRLATQQTRDVLLYGSLAVVAVGLFWRWKK